jgi:Protein of unknown function (DUF2877)
MMTLDPSFRGASEAREPGIQRRMPSRWIPDSRAARGFRNDREMIIPIRRAGVVAAEFCKSPARAEVAAVFERSFYLRADDLFVCVGEPGIGSGPLTLIADTPTARLGLHPGEPARIGQNSISIGAVTFTCESCEPWHPPHWPRAAAPDVLVSARETIVHRAAADAPAEGFGRLLIDANAPSGAFARIARQRLARLQSWLVESLAARGAPMPADPVRDLAGLGPGLTPSGDDVLIGALALLDALAQDHAQADRMRAHLARAVGHLPPGLTSPLSHCFLRVAAAGHVGERLHAAVSSCVIGDVDAVIAAVGDIGHSSGWDMLAGVVTALDALTSGPTQPCAADSRNR